MRAPWTSLAPTSAALLAGLVLRLASLGESLWLDELSTLWAVESSFGDVLRRVPSVMGQTPLYFAFAWSSVRTFGESEWALRLPSLLAVAGTTGMVALAAARLHGRRAAAWTAVLFWLCYPAVWASVDARPYGLAMLFAAMGLWGWTGACLQGSRPHRWLWIGGTAGLIWSHYVFLPFALAAPVAYALIPASRQRYRPWQFLGDAAMTAVLVVPASVQFAGIVATREAHAWSLASSHLAVPILLAPFALAMLMPVARRQTGDVTRAILGMFWVSIGLQVAALEASALVEMDLLATRYAYVVLVPASLIAGCNLARLRGADLVAPLAVFALGTGLALYATYRIAGSWTGAGYQEWRQAVEAVRVDMASNPGAPVLFRSGNAEDDLRPPGEIGWPATLAPLRSPGVAAPDWRIMLLTYRWHRPDRALYLETLARRLDDEPVFYLLCLSSEEPDAGGYCPPFVDWVANTWPGVKSTPLGTFRQLTAVRFDQP